MRPVIWIALLTLVEAHRRRIVLAALICGVVFVACFAAGLSLIERSASPQTPWELIRHRTALHGLSIAGLYVANFLTLVTAVLLPVDTVSGEIASGVAQTLASKPIRRAEILLGKWLGYWLLVAAYLAVTGGGIILAARAISGFGLPNLYLGLPLILLGATVMLTVSIAGGTRFSTVTNGIVAFGVYGVAFIGGWVEQIGLVVAESETARVGVRDIGTVASLLSPPDALWRLAAYHMLPPVARDLPLTPFTPMFPPSVLMVVWAIGYVVAVLLAALVYFKRRPL